jgi:8-amino-7-oxononanoate synthase
MDDFLRTRLQQYQQANLYRTRQCHERAQAPILMIAGKPYLSFCSNDYLGLASEPRLKQALQQGMEQYALGSGASHLITGHTQAHHELEQALAAYTGRERALLFSTGYMANLGVITALLGRQDAVFLDKLNHASLIDAALLSRAKLYRYAHHDMGHLEQLLAQSPAQHRLIVTDGVFSMDGDLAPLPMMVELAKRYDAWLMVDDAHGLGVLGQHGRGSLETYHLTSKQVPILMGTLGKAFGVFGAFVAGSELLIENLIQFARSYIYTTALPPALAVAAQTSLHLAQTETWRRKRLQTLISYFRQAALAKQLPLMDSSTPIQPILLRQTETALAVSKALYNQGIIVTAIRPPTVPAGTARLRVTLSALHEETQIDRLINEIII